MSIVKSFIFFIRPVQWLKNLMLFFPPFLGGIFFHKGLLLNGLMPFASFCFASSAVYVFNDIQDVSRDQLHPVKRYRPLPSGAISTNAAYFIALLLLVASILLGILLPKVFLGYLVLYVFVCALYSLSLKNSPVVELFCISSGFIFRLMAGGEVFLVPVSEWLFLSVFLLSLFLASGKRLGEKRLLGDSAVQHRQVLASYPQGFLDGVLVLTGSAVLVTYSMYAVSRHSVLLTATVPLCCFGLLRYILRVKSGGGGDPTESLTKDLPLFITGLLWAVMIGWGIYVR